MIISNYLLNLFLFEGPVRRFKPLMFQAARLPMDTRLTGCACTLRTFTIQLLIQKRWDFSK
ncbi:hypothetical protein Hanom_Chr07g00624101 [Helianthus anomalus]